jgi:hypothetical protein
VWLLRHRPRAIDLKRTQSGREELLETTHACVAQKVIPVRYAPEVTKPHNARFFNAATPLW